MALAMQTIELPDSCDRIALCGGPYNNFAAVEAFLEATENIDYRYRTNVSGGTNHLRLCPKRKAG